MSIKGKYSESLEHARFSLILKLLMEEKGITQTALAKELHMSRNTIANYTSASGCFPDINALIKIAEFFNVSTDYLLGLSKERNTDADMDSACNYFGIKRTTGETLKRLDSRFVNLLFSYVPWKYDRKGITNSQRLLELSDLFVQLVSPCDTDMFNLQKELSNASSFASNQRLSVTDSTSKLLRTEFQKFANSVCNLADDLVKMPYSEQKDITGDIPRIPCTSLNNLDLDHIETIKHSLENALSIVNKYEVNNNGNSTNQEKQ